ncbi:Clavaminate synthase-like protein [Vararia minispora EC-137]|uniref:Clavaminate synthase-like protein n=1 Tax=Vararia minispora EC-137 TaxID=1314806 RepID=A0ACB8QX99_9AGAM|nr:Clavaminate synthase-like protein [Vararia minispora EC-137]
MPDVGPAPFPDDVPIVPLVVIDYGLIKRREISEIDKLWEAATHSGFWYLKNYGPEEAIDGMFAMGEETMDLPLEEKMKFTQGTEGRSFGYKFAEANAVDEHGTPENVEYINISREDALAWPDVVHRTYPETVVARMENTIIPFVRQSMEVNGTLIDVLNDKLGLPEGTLAGKHAPDMHSGSEARTIKSPKNQNVSDSKVLLGAHTDFGSLTFLHHRIIGGLQVMLPGSEEWKYVKPIPRHAICNIGDALHIFSGGILISSLHRVVPPPKAQAAHERWSVVFHSRPGDHVVLEALSEKSEAIAKAVATAPPGQSSIGSTAGEWYARRMKNRLLVNRKGRETYLASAGTEHNTSVY